VDPARLLRAQAARARLAGLRTISSPILPIQEAEVLVERAGCIVYRIYYDSHWSSNVSRSHPLDSSGWR
jgi:hypothetical protein